MPTVREHLKANGGGFVKALLKFHDEPTFDNLMEAYTVADLDNRRALRDAAKKARITEVYDANNSCYTGVYLDLDEVHQMWLKMRWGGEMIEPLHEQFEAMARLDEDVAEPWKVPLRRKE